MKRNRTDSFSENKKLKKDKIFDYLFYLKLIKKQNDNSYRDYIFFKEKALFMFLNNITTPYYLLSNQLNEIYREYNFNHLSII